MALPSRSAVPCSRAAARPSAQAFASRDPIGHDPVKIVGFFRAGKLGPAQAWAARPAHPGHHHPGFGRARGLDLLVSGPRPGGTAAPVTSATGAGRSRSCPPAPAVTG